MHDALRYRADTTALPSTLQELGFVTLLVRPLYVCLGRIVPELAFYVDRIDASIAMWTAARAEAISAAMPHRRGSVAGQNLGV